MAVTAPPVTLMAVTLMAVTSSAGTVWLGMAQAGTTACLAPSDVAADHSRHLK